MQEIDNKGVLLNVLSAFVQNAVILTQIVVLNRGARSGKAKKSE